MRENEAIVGVRGKWVVGVREEMSGLSEGK